MASYNEIKNMVFDLPPEEQLRLIDDILSDVRHRAIAKPQRKIRDLLKNKLPVSCSLL